MAAAARVAALLDSAFEPSKPAIAYFKTLCFVTGEDAHKLAETAFVIEQAFNDAMTLAEQHQVGIPYEEVVAMTRQQVPGHLDKYFEGKDNEPASPAQVKALAKFGLTKGLKGITKKVASKRLDTAFATKKEEWYNTRM